MDSERIIALVFLLTMAGGLGVVIMAMRQRSQRMDLAHREAMAMIERGMVPAGVASADPRGGGPDRSAASSRSLTLGIVVVATGLALMTLISVAFGQPGAGVGVGGAVALIGAAFVVNSLVSRPPHVPSVPPVPREPQL